MVFGRSDDELPLLRQRIEVLERRIADLEHTVRALTGQLDDGHLPAYGTARPTGPVDGLPPGAMTAEVQQLALAGKTIQAIKLHREQTGLGLKEAKEAVERLRP